MGKKKTPIMFFEEDMARIKELAALLTDQYGGFLSQRVAIMMAVSRMVKEEKKNAKS